MPCKIILRAVSTVHANPRKGWKKGHIIQVLSDSWVPGNDDLNSNILVRITDSDVATMSANWGAWNRDLEYTSSEHSTSSADNYFKVTIKGTDASIGTNTNGVLTLSECQTFLELVGATAIDFKNDKVEFDLYTLTALGSSWFRRATTATLASVSYSSNIHRCTLTYSESDYDKTIFADIIADRGGSVVSNTGGVCTFDIDRSVVLTKVQASVNKRFAGMIGRSARELASADVDTIVAAGGTAEMTKATFEGKLVLTKDK